MSDGLDVIILDDDPSICELISESVGRFYTWGEIYKFTGVDQAILYCLNRDTGIAIFIVDIFLGEKSGFYFLDAIGEKYTTAHEDSICITGNASNDIVNMCVASDICHLLEKPIRPYALQLAVKSITTKYLKFAKKILKEPDFARMVATLQKK